VNQDDVKAVLVGLRPTQMSFTLVFSGKKSSRVNGLYKPATREIVLHNRNFESDNDLLFTALHEYAHHLNCTEYEGKSGRAHTVKFWAILHDLLALAEKKGLYRNPAKTEAFDSTTKSLSGLIEESGKIMKEIGKALIEAQSLCEKEGARFDDYVMRTLKQTMPWAQAAMRAASYDLDASLGAENLKAVSAIRDSDERRDMAAALAPESEKSPQQVRAARAEERQPEDVVERLEKEKECIARTVGRLLARADAIEDEIQEFKENGCGGGQYDEEAQASSA
jgi:hypothetical protein